MTSTPAGWYADPSNPAQRRYWDGAQWTEHFAVAAPQTTPAQQAQPAQPAPGFYPVEPTKKKLSGGAIAAIVIGGLVVLVFVGGIIAAIAIPIFLSQSAQADDADARADVSTLGKEIATYYVDNSGAVPPIEVSGDYYLIDIGTAAPLDVVKSEGVEFGGVEGTGPTDWCVWVEATSGDIGTFQYSAIGGLEPGTCS